MEQWPWGGVVVEGTDLTRVLFASLEQTGGAWGETGPKGGLQVKSNPLLTTLSLPVLRTAGLILIADNPVLTTVKLPALATAASIDFDVPTTNARSRSLQVLEPIGARVVGTGGNSALAILSLPALTSVRTLSIGAENAALRTLDLPALTSGQLMVGAPVLSDLSLPAMVGGTVILGGATLASVELPALASGSVFLTGTRLTNLSLPVLSSAGWLDIQEAPALAGVSLPALAAADGIRFEQCPSLAMLSLPALTESTYLYVDQTSLAALSLPALTTVGQGLHVVGNPDLAEVAAPALTAVGTSGCPWYCELTISMNASLPQCWAEGLLARLSVVPTVVDLSGNDTAATCPPSQEPCAGTRTDNGDGTTTIACLDGTKDLVCTNGDCSGVSRWVDIVGTDLTRVILQTLTSVEHLLVWDNPALTEVHLPALGFTVEWGAGLSIARNQSLTKIDVPRLASGTVGIVDNPALMRLSLPSLVSVPGFVFGDRPCHGGLAVLNSAALTSLDLPSLEAAGTIRVQDNPVLPSLSLPALRRSGAEDEYGCVSVSRNRLLETIDMSAMVHAEELDVIENGVLAELRMPALTTVRWSMAIRDNIALPQCAAEAILAQLVAFTGSATISGNDTTATCSP